VKQAWFSFDEQPSRQSSLAHAKAETGEESAEDAPKRKLVEV